MELTTEVTIVSNEKSRTSHLSVQSCRDIISLNVFIRNILLDKKNLLLSKDKKQNIINT